MNKFLGAIEKQVNGTCIYFYIFRIQSMKCRGIFICVLCLFAIGRDLGFHVLFTMNILLCIGTRAFGGNGFEQYWCVMN